MSLASALSLYSVSCNSMVSFLCLCVSVSVCKCVCVSLSLSLSHTHTQVGDAWSLVNAAAEWSVRTNFATLLHVVEVFMYACLWVCV
jgi:hypothetical protein